MVRHGDLRLERRDLNLRMRKECTIEPLAFQISVRKKRQNLKEPINLTNHNPLEPLSFLRS